MKRKGFTLVELMIALAIFSIVVGFIYKTYFNEIRVFSSTNNQNQIQYDVNTTMNYLLRELRNNTNISYEKDSNGNIIKLTNGNIVLLDTVGLSGNINYDKASKSLKDKSGNVLCNGISNISLDLGDDLPGDSSDVVKITLSFHRGNEDFQISSGININE